ncbi:multidrug resistance efflux pump [Cylindrospermum stagnale PCC 7417]|uniref:Multidrug resistance efflux pump n=1 Tax=Cylindrospermum stagnale PCC 7417 TaxID=56107 RepID=K9X1M9_9NOST|nr:biotin/lipoyl-binding protein [Cylindrospermum stagnale]AFZ25969.1 multidrug resistance efflux pump [Cylindrospermum stagnale PCC 7417]
MAPSGKKPLFLILAALGVGAIAAGSFGYRYWQYTSSHQETDNAIVAGHIHQVSSKIPGTVSQVLVSDNQLVQPGQLLVQLDLQDDQSKVQQAKGAQFALLPPDNATGNFTKIVQRIPVKIVFDQKSIQKYNSRITPGMSAEVSVEVK